MAANGISTLTTKQERQVAKLEYAQAKRKGRVITDGGALGVYGTWSDDGIDNDTINYYRSNNTYDISSLPDVYNGNVPGADDNPNPGGLLPKRPWIAVGALSNPGSIDEAVGGDTLADLEIWYDGSDDSTIVPTGIMDEDFINQWNDKSGNEHNLNFDGGNNKPTYESSDLQNTHEYVQFEDGDLMSINPITAISGATAFSVFVIAKTTDIATNDPQILTSTENDELSIQIAADGSVTFQAASGNSASAAGGTVSQDSWYVYSLIYDGTNAIVGRVNDGTTVTAAGAGNGPAALNAGSTYMYVGGNSSSGTFIGDLGEVIMFKRALSATEYANVENYLTTKWGL